MFTPFFRWLGIGGTDPNYYSIETGKIGPDFPPSYYEEKERIEADKGIQFDEWDDWLIGGVILWVVLSTKPWK